MARISLSPAPSLTYRLGAWYSRRRYGVIVGPLAALCHNPKVIRSVALFELGVQRWRTLDHGLKDLAVMAAAARIGCAWCLDFGYWEATVNHAVTPEKIRAVPGWRDSGVFTERERAVLEYAEAMSDTPPGVTDELVARLRRYLSEPQLVELTAIIAVENQRSRMNAALGLTAQGFRDRCELTALSGKRRLPV
jgi:alkylhydroperoxidase family enzyme